MSRKPTRCTYNRQTLEAILRERKLDDFEIRSALYYLPEDYVCGKETYNDGVFCIFHVELKDDSEFKSRFQEEFERMQAEQDRLFDFSGFIFPKIDFSLLTPAFSVIFNKPASFVGATFRGETSFLGVTFQEIAHFDGTKFEENASFTGVTFKEAIFDRTTFRKETSFAMAVFQKNVSFEMAEFQDVSFFGTIFMRASFGGARFRGEADFANSVFVDNIRFSYTDVTGQVKFIGNPYAQEPDLDEFWEELNEEQRRQQESTRERLHRLKMLLKMGEISLETLSFIGTEVSKIEFLNVKWNEKRFFRIGPLKLSRVALYDELALYGTLPPRDYGTVAALYRDLRHNYERRLRYPEAGDFYIGEMEMRRLQTSIQVPSLAEDTTQSNKEKKEESRSLWRRKICDLKWQSVQKVYAVWSWLRRNLLSPIAWYRNLSLYGESYTLAASWAVGAILFFAILRVTFNMQTLTPSNLFNSLTRSFLAFFQLSSETLPDYAERVLGAFLLGMLFIALKRRFERH